MDIEAQRAKVKKWSSIALVGVVGLLVSPVIFLAIQGLIGLIIAGVVGLAVVTFTPYMTMKFAQYYCSATI